MTLGPWTDIYGLSATLYHAITGQIPPSAVERILKDTYQPLAELRPPGYEPALLAGIDAGLATRVEDRPQSIAEWRSLLRAEGALSSQQPTFVSRKPGHSARAARRSPQARATLRSPALWSATAAAILALATAGWFAWQANTPPAANAAALSLSTEQLELVLAERRKADALAADKRRLEEEARQKAEAEAEAKRQAEAELEQARQARQKAEEELARLKADMETRRQAEAGQREPAEATATRRAAEEEAQRKAEADAAALRQAEEEAAKKAAADAEAKRQADEALARAAAERQRAEEEARAKAEAEATAMRQASEEAQRKAAEAESKRAAEVQAKAQAEREKADAEARAKAEAEAAEKGLRLENKDRERLQVALTSLGFDTRGSDGIFGPRSREIIAAWQKKAGAPTTGFLTAAQRDQLLRGAAVAVTRWEEEQRKAEEERKKVEATKTAAAAAERPNTSAAPAESGRQAEQPDAHQQTASTTIQASASFVPSPANISSCSSPPGVRRAVRIYPDKIEMQMNWGWEVFKVGDDGSFSGNVIGTSAGRHNISGAAARLSIRGNTRSKEIRIETLDTYRCSWTGTLSAGQQISVGLSASPDGLWRGTYKCETVAAQLPSFALDLEIRLSNGSGTWRNPSTSGYNANTLDISVVVNRGVVTVTRAFAGSLSAVGGRATLTGRFEENTISAEGVEQSPARQCRLDLRRA